MPRIGQPSCRSVLLRRLMEELLRGQATVVAAGLRRTMSRMAASSDAAEKAAILDEVAAGWPSKSSTCSQFRQRTWE